MSLNLGILIYQVENKMELILIWLLWKWNDTLHGLLWEHNKSHQIIIITIIIIIILYDYFYINFYDCQLYISLILYISFLLINFILWHFIPVSNDSGCLALHLLFFFLQTPPVPLPFKSLPYSLLFKILCSEELNQGHLSKPGFGNIRWSPLGLYNCICNLFLSQNLLAVSYSKS